MNSFNFDQDQLNQLVGPIVLLAMGITGLGIVVLLIRRFFRAAPQEESTATSSLMTGLRELQQSGELSEEEYRALKAQLNNKLAGELDVKLTRPQDMPQMPSSLVRSEEDELEEIPIEPDPEALAMMQRAKQQTATTDREEDDQEKIEDETVDESLALAAQAAQEPAAMADSASELGDETLDDSSEMGGMDLDETIAEENPPRTPE